MSRVFQLPSVSLLIFTFLGFGCLFTQKYIYMLVLFYPFCHSDVD
ncbi:unnamed protein product [Rodentolepis nana]|uniref:Lipoprotein n=1 Tax=Rodentolepis nana TaxID=102285 RepID=A0A0R3TL23_RODNA|nr:unnamed protein product [Rodentolepis nana]